MARAAPNEGPTFARELPNAIASVEDARLALTGFLEPYDIGADVMNRVEVILEELVSNVARHSAGATMVRLEAELDENEVHLTIIDDGPAFNPLEQDDPDAFDKLDNARLGGLGIPLLKRLPTSAHYERCGKYNRVSASFKRA